MTGGLVKTLEAMCRDCYRCVRACPVKAIGIKNNQAFINPDRCINCGTCVKTCLQKAKVDESQLDDVKKIVKSGDVVACVAPIVRSRVSRISPPPSGGGAPGPRL